MTGLPHPLFQMEEVHLRMIGGNQTKSYPIPPLDPAFPFAAENGMHFPAKKSGKLNVLTAKGIGRRRYFMAVVNPEGGSVSVSSLMFSV